jgi:hypothetical protein
MTNMKQLEISEATLTRILASAKANPCHLAPTPCERIEDDMPASFLLSKAGQGSQEEYVDFLQPMCISKYQNMSIKTIVGVKTNSFLSKFLFQCLSFYDFDCTARSYCTPRIYLFMSSN